MGDRSLQALWAATDKESIDRMKPRTASLAAKFGHHHFTSSEESSESDLDTNSEASFIAVPREFRPNVLPKQSPSVRKKSVNKSSALTGGTKRLPIPPLPTKSPNDPTSTNSSQISEAISTNKSLLLKENSVSIGKRMLRDRDTAEINIEPRQKVTIDAIIPRKDGKYLEIIDQSGVTQIYHNGKTPPISLPTGNNYSKSFQKKDKPKGIEFECVNVPEHIRITRTQTIEINIGNLDKNQNKVIIDTPTSKKCPEIKKTIRFYPQKKTQKRYYCSNKKEHSSFKNFPNLSKGDTVKWNSMIGLNKSVQLSPNISKPIKENLSETLKATSYKKVEWTVIEEERVCDSGQRLSCIDDLHKNKIYNFIDKNKTKNFYNSGHELPERTQLTKDKSCRIKLHKKTEDTKNNCFLNNYTKELTEKVGSEDTKFYSTKNNSTKGKHLETNRSTEIHLDLYQQQKQECYSRKETELPENTSKQNTDFFFKTPHMNFKSPHMNKLKYGVTSDLSNLDCSNEISQQQNNAIMKKSNNFENVYSLMHFGKEVSDFVIGSHTALSTFFSIYNEWERLRYELIGQFQQLEKTIQESSKRYNWYQDLLRVSNGVALVASNVPLPHAGTAAKIVSVLTSLLSMFVKTSDKKQLDMDEPEVTRLLLRDIQNSSELYMHGMQCNFQFEETRKIIEEFHSFIMNSAFMETSIECFYMLEFVKGVKEYTPKHRIFYKKLQNCYKELLKKASSPYSRRFCEPFLLDTSNAVDVIRYLDWRFIEVDNATVEAELEEIQCLIQSNGKSTSMKDLASKIKNCIMILNDELESVRKCVSKIPLFHTEFSLKLK